jgi:hypothetical protein
LGIFPLVSTITTGLLHTYSGNDHKLSDGSLQSNFGLVEAPD